MLTEKQIAELQKPFELKEHGFLQKNPYILKSAIRNRLNRIAPGWTLLAPEIMTVDTDVVIMRGGIQIGDVKRYGVGAGPILRADKDGVVFTGSKLMAQIAKAYKQAASDILPRAALEFGLGEYLKDKPKKVNEDNFAEWLTKLNTPPADPNAWTPDNILAWGDKWRTKNLSNDQLCKALGITGKWTDFKGTVSEADKAVEAFINISTLDQPAQPKSAMAVDTSLQRIACPTNLLEKDDVVEIGTVPGIPTSRTTRYRIISNRGMVGNQIWLQVHNLLTDIVETVHWSKGNQMLIAGPKVEAYAKDPSVCVPQASSLMPLWNGQFAATG